MNLHVVFTIMYYDFISDISNATSSFLKSESIAEDHKFGLNSEMVYCK